MLGQMSGTVSNGAEWDRRWEKRWQQVMTNVRLLLLDVKYLMMVVIFGGDCMVGREYLPEYGLPLHVHDTISDTTQA